MVAQLNTPLGQWIVRAGYKSAVMRGLGGQHMALGSQNGMLTGEGFVRAFKGVDIVGGKVGSRLLVTIDQSYAGLGTQSAVAVSGSVYQVRELLMYCGNGQVTFDGAALDVSIVASSTLSFIKRAAGVYVPSVATGPYQAGRAQPSAPILYPKDVPSANQRAMSGAVAVVIWRASDVDGQPSLASLASNIVVLSDQSAIVQIPLPDANGQNITGIGVPRIGFIDLGVMYQLPISLGGEVSESVLSYTRAVTGATIVDTTDIVDITDADVADQFTGADVGRRIAFGAFDSYIIQINSATQVQVADANDSGGDITADATITHAIDGITRAIEISWTNEDLVLQDIAPDRAFPPPAVLFSGAMNDVLWAEGEDGIIYVGDPGFIGSFPPDNALFAAGEAVLYLRASGGLTIRFEHHNVGALYYVGGSPALEYQTIIENQGIKYAQNAGLGANGRVCAWLGQPTTVDSATLEPDFGYALDVLPDFAGWNEAQTALRPIVFGYDGREDGRFECWMLGKKVMAKHVPTNQWCSPVDLTGKITGDIVEAVQFEHGLRLSCVDGAALNLYDFDAGTGSLLIVRTDEIEGAGYGDTINEVMAQIRADTLANKCKVEVVTNYDDHAYTVYDAVPVKLGTQQLPVALMRPDILNVRQHSLQFTIESAGGIVVDGVAHECGIDWGKTKGSTSETVQ